MIAKRIVSHFYIYKYLFFPKMQSETVQQINKNNNKKAPWSTSHIPAVSQTTAHRGNLYFCLYNGGRTNEIIYILGRQINLEVIQLLHFKMSSIFLFAALSRMQKYFQHSILGAVVIIHIQFLYTYWEIETVLDRGLNLIKFLSLYQRWPRELSNLKKITVQVKSSYIVCVLLWW